VRPSSLRDLREATGQDLDDLPGEAGVELSLLETGLNTKERVLAGPKVAEVLAGGQSEEVGCGEGRTQSDSLRRFGQPTSQLQAEGSRS
jgi:hypothetical protein